MIAMLGDWVRKGRQLFCSHRFAIDDLVMVNRDSDGEDRIAWACDKCGRVFRAHCGLSISPRHGPVFRREPPNVPLSRAPE